MKTYSLIIVLDGEPIDDAACEAAYEAGCDDATFVTRGGVSHAAFDRESPSLEQAIQAAADDLRSAGLTIRRVELAPPLEATTAV